MQRLRDIRKQQGLTQDKLAHKLNVVRSTIAMYETGASEPDFQTLRRISEILNVSVDYLLGLSNDPHMSESILIPIYREIKKNFDSTNIDEDNVINYVEYSTLNAFGMIMNDDSMSPIILPGDTIIASVKEVKNNDLCIVLVNNEYSVVRKVLISSKGYTLQALNSEYPPQFYANSEIENNNIKICGIISQIRRDFK